MAADELARRGWHLTSEGQDQCVENGNRSVDTIVKNALNLDLRDIGDKWLPADLSTGRVKVDYVEGPGVLQVLKLRNISAPKENEESQTAPRLWKITLTDGHSNAVAICLEPLQNISLLTPPGSKILLEGTVDVECTYLLLTNKNARLLGGRVSSLVESWELKKKLAQQSRVGIQSEGAPPPFTPFGKKIATVDAPRKDNFKSLAASKQTKEEEDSEFQQQRQATIAEALTAKTKTFGGGPKPAINDRDLARIMEMGFTADQASNALRQSNGSVNDAITALLSGGGGFGGGAFGGGRGGGRGGFGGGRGGVGGGPMGRGDQRGGDDNREDSGRRGGRGGRGGRRGRGERGDEEEEVGSGRPSGPTTLFDFLETKIPSKPEGSSNARPSSAQSGGQQKPPSFNHRPNTTSNVDASRGDSSRSQSSGYSSGPQQSRSQPNARFRDRENKDNGREGEGGGPGSARSTNNTNFHPADSRDYGGSGGGGGGRDRGGGGGGGGYGDDYNNQGRRQQNLPPRLANKLARDNAPQNSSRPPKNQDSGGDNKPRYSGGGVGGGPPNPGGYQGNRNALREQNSSGGYQGDRGQNAPDFQENFNKMQQHQQGGGPGPRQRNDQQRQGRRQGGPMWQRGQMVLAKYWEDEQVYRAVIEAVAENGATAVVTFLEYGNQEEVLCSDIHPLPPQPNWNNSYPPPPPHQGGAMMPPPGPGFYPPGPGFGPPGMPNPPPFPGQESFNAGPIPNMEFRRGGAGPAHRRQERPDQNDRRRPTQNYYTPPTRNKKEE